MFIEKSFTREKRRLFHDLPEETFSDYWYNEIKSVGVRLVSANEFREHMRKEANFILSKIKQEKNPVKKRLLCENLLEIYEELDIEIAKTHSLWTEIQMDYEDFVR